MGGGGRGGGQGSDNQDEGQLHTGTPVLHYAAGSSTNVQQWPVVLVQCTRTRLDVQGADHISFSVWEMRCTLTLSLLLVVMHHLGH